MSRTHDRRHVLRLVFQMEFFKEFEPKEAIERYFDSFVTAGSDSDLAGDDGNATGKEIDREFVEKEFFGTIENKVKIDEIINGNMSGWNITRLSKTDLAILRLAVYEMFFASDVPLGVSVHEAVELAKIFSSDDSPAFINGVLGQISEGVTSDSVVKINKKRGVTNRREVNRKEVNRGEVNRGEVNRGEVNRKEVNRGIEKPRIEKRGIDKNGV